MVKIICVVCRLLEGLCGDIQTLVGMFARLNSTISQLVKEHKDMKCTAEDLQDDRDGATQMNPADHHIFRTTLHEMKKVSIMINAMSGLYADVIAEVISPGFSKVVATACEDGGETNLSVIVYNKERNMNDYLSRAEKLCRAKEREADAKLSRRLAEVEEARPLKSRKKFGGGGKPAPGGRRKLQSLFLGMFLN
jgi:hypothetical protein